MVLPGGIGNLIADMFSAQLGQTEDPTELIPGSPEAVHNNAESLRREGVRFDDTAHSLGQVRIPGWLGQASDSFWDRFNPEKYKWQRAADAMNNAADLLDQHGETVQWAQDQAAEAIELWRKGEQATAQARAKHAADVAAFNQQQADMQQSGLTNIMAPRPPTFVDPGEALRQQAQEILKRARQQLKEQGDAVADALLPGGDDEPSWLSKAIDVADTAIRENGLGNTSIANDLAGNSGLSDSRWGNSTSRKFGDTGEDGDGDGLSWKVKLFEHSDGVDVWGGELSGSTEFGPGTASGSLSASVLGAGYNTEFSLGPDGLTAKAGVEAYLAKVGAEGAIDVGPVGVGAQGELFVGAEAEASATIGKDGVRLQAEAFAGAKAEGSVHADVGGVGAGVKGEAWAGVGASADFTAGMNDGKFTIGGELGAALGIGGKIGFEITVDPGKVIDTAQDVASAVGDAANAVGNAASSTANAVGNAASSAAGAVGDGAKSVYDNTLGKL